MRILGYIFLFFLLMQQCFAQDTALCRSFFVSGSFLQVKEKANYGLVFKGPALDIGSNWNFPCQNYSIVYENHLGYGLPITKGITGMNISFKPADLGFLWNITSNKNNLQLGPAVKMEYNIQLYSNLQSGYDFWLTNYCAGMTAMTNIPTNIGNFRLSLFSSLTGLTSRNEIYEDPYFFDLSFGEVIKDIHSNFKLSTVNDFYNATLRISYRVKNSSRFSISYILDYFNYSVNPELKFLNQSVRLAINPKNKQK